MAEVIKLPSIPDQPVDVSKDENFSDEQKGQQTNQAQSLSTNSHHHDSEYDTASDLEGGDDDDYDDEDDESLGADGEEDDVESENESIVFDVERQRGDGQETDYAKKVDEDRSNPQYIPKKGTFYEHDDRTADDLEGNEHRIEEGGDDDTTKSSTPTISASSKTMKKWQPASAVDRWSHDRYDESEQAPKSRAELVSAYGYDIRNEDGPPRARRRRRYGRGPTKYSRNWEDENAYIKPTNSQRKPRPEDFPALGDKKRKSRSFREEKENRYEKQNERGGNRMVGHSSQRDVRTDRRSSGKSFRSGGRQSMDFKNQTKNRSFNEVPNRNSLNRTNDRSEHLRHSLDDPKSQVESVSFTNTKAVSNSQTDRFNGHDAVHISQISGHRELKDKLSNLNSSSIMPNRQTAQASQIATRLQQIQSRNEPSHVGSVQMHSLINQNQPDMQQASAESGKTKRYSSLRQRSQNDAVVPMQNTQIEQHSLQQMQIHEHHQQQQQPQQTQHVLLQDQHLLQANLMQLYHTQDNLQAQMQGVTIQSLPAGHQAKPQFQNVQQQYQTTPSNTPAYYAPVTEYAAAAATSPPAAQPQYNQQQPATFIQQQATTPQIAYNAQSPPPVPPATQQIPTALNYVQAPPNPPTNPPYQNYPGYHQNFNTVGGTTYFVPPQQPPPRPVVIPQRRPTNAIPILAPPSDKAKKAQEERDEENKNMSSASNAPIGSAENIDHILDNMFVQRPPYQPPTSRKSSSPATESVGTSTSSVVDEKVTLNSSGGGNETSLQSRLEDSIKNLSLNEEPQTLSIPEQPMQQPQPPLPIVASPTENPQNETG